MFIFFVIEPEFTVDKFVQPVLLVPEEVKCRFYACHTIFLKGCDSLF